MRTVVIGDIHGCSRAFDTLLKIVGPVDRIITLGDYVDRGPDSRGILDRLIQLHKEGKLIAVRGNHDMMMVESAQGRLNPLWMFHGGKETLESYGTNEKRNWVDAIPPEHLDFLESKLVNYHEDNDFFCVHARVEAGMPLEDQPDSALFWEKLEDPLPHYSGKTMICGHTRMPDGLPVRFPGTIAIDTSVYTTSGWLTALEWPSLSFWQANQLGQAREGKMG